MTPEPHFHEEWDGQERRTVPHYCPFSRDEWRTLVADLRKDVRDALTELKDSSAALETRLRMVEIAVARNANGPDELNALERKVEKLEAVINTLSEAVTELRTKMTVSAVMTSAVVSLFVAPIIVAVILKFVL